MNLQPMKIFGAFRIVLTPYQDARGFFVRTYDKDAFAKMGLARDWIQESHSFSAKKGTLRGLHFQRPPHAETKLIHLVQGRIFMVLLDLRSASVTFGKWEGVVLSMDTPEALYIPKGLALGMYTLTDHCSLLYKMDTAYSPEYAGTILWRDSDLGIAWPLEGNPILSDKDAHAPTFKDFLAKDGALKV